MLGARLAGDAADRHPTFAQTAELMPLDARTATDYYSYPEVTAPSFSKWRAAGAKALVTGFVQARSDGRLTVGCYVYDVDKGRELARKGFVVGAERLAPRRAQMLGPCLSRRSPARPACSTRASPMSPRAARRRRAVKRIAIMDSDGYQPPLSDRRRHDGADPAPVAQGGAQLAYVSFAGGKPQVRVARPRLAATQRPLVPGDAMSFAPRFSPDGSADRLLDDAAARNTDIYVVGADGGAAAAADHLARHRHRPELLARRQQDRVRKRPRRDRSSST